MEYVNFSCCLIQRASFSCSGSGRKFDFAGKPGAIFNLLSEQNHQLNSRFVAGPHMVSVNGNDKLGTYMYAAKP